MSSLFKTVCQYEILSEPIAPVAGVPYVEQGFFLQIYNYDNVNSAKMAVYFVSNPPIDTKADGALRFGANLIRNNGPIVPITVNCQSNAIFFPVETLQPRDCFIFGVQYYLQPGKSVQKLGTTPTESASSRGMVQILFPDNTVPNFKSFPTIRQVFTSFDASGNVTEVTSNAYAVPGFDAVPLVG